MQNPSKVYYIDFKFHWKSKKKNIFKLVRLKFKMAIKNEPDSKPVEKKSNSTLIWLNPIALFIAINTCNLTK